MALGTRGLRWDYLVMDQSDDGTPGKKPPAASMTERRSGDVIAEIAHELLVVLERLDANEELLAIVGSWRDTFGDGEVLALLREYNRSGRVMHHPQ